MTKFEISASDYNTINSQLLHNSINANTNIYIKHFKHNLKMYRVYDNPYDNFVMFYTVNRFNDLEDQQIISKSEFKELSANWMELN